MSTNCGVIVVFAQYSNNRVIICMTQPGHISHLSEGNAARKCNTMHCNVTYSNLLNFGIDTAMNSQHLEKLQVGNCIVSKDL